MATAVESLIINIHEKTPEQTLAQVEQFITYATTRKIRFEVKKITIVFNEVTKQHLAEYIVSDTLNVNGTVYQFGLIEDYNNGNFLFYFYDVA